MSNKANESSSVIREPDRLAALQRLALLDTSAEEAFDRLTRLAATILHAPVALVSLVDADRQFFKSCIGLPEPWASQRGTPLSHSFCQHAVVSGEPLIISDASEHPLVRDNLAIPDLGVVAYAGIPLITADGYALGSFCVIDTEPRVWTAEEIDIVRDLAAAVMTEIELRVVTQALQRERDELERRVQERTAALSDANVRLRSELVERQRVEEALRASEAHFRSLFENTTIGLYRTTPDGRILLANPTLVHSLGYPSFDALAARNLEEEGYPPGYTRQRFREQIERDGKITGLEAVWTKRDGGLLYVRESATVIRDAGGEVLYYEGTVEDITKYKRTEAALRTARDEAERLEELEALRTTFIASVSHDLWTPLTAARAALVLLRASAADRHRRDEQSLLDNAQRNIQRLTLLIADLLAYNQLDAGVMRLHSEICDLHAVVADAASAVHPLIHEKGQQLIVDLTQPLLCCCDQQQLEHVVVNLVGNAHRHTPTGTHIVVAGHVAGREIVLAVHDTGPGVPAEEQELIFQRFYRAGTCNHGSGLGLAIARRIIELHGGRIWVESQCGAGTTFFVALPRITSEGRL